MFKTRYKEHMTAMQYNQDNSKFAQHILNTTHYFGTLEETMEILRTAEKGRYLDTLDNYHIFKYNKKTIK
jgi:hypothetical protein